jgi:predicted Rossmann fold nucleotide-binding protein DprA/Smf involved in DNA uptake
VSAQIGRRIAIVGSRDFPNEQLVRAFVHSLPKSLGIQVVSGGAPGVDTWAASEAEKCGLEVKVFRPDYKKFVPNRAPKERNTTIAEYADYCVAFWSGRDGGTTDVVGKFVLRGKAVEVHR